MWKRYRNDGWALIKLGVSRVLPLLALTWWQKLRSGPKGFSVAGSTGSDHFVCKLEGDATAAAVERAAGAFRQTIGLAPKIVLDFTDVRTIDARFIGALLMFRKQLIRRGQSLEFVGIQRPVASIFRFSGFEYLLTQSA